MKKHGFGKKLKNRKFWSQLCKLESRGCKMEVWHRGLAEWSLGVPKVIAKTHKWSPGGPGALLVGLGDPLGGAWGVLADAWGGSGGG